MRLQVVANKVYAELGCVLLSLRGAVVDFRAPYASADLLAGISGPALRGIASGKSTAVVGERGFSASVCPETFEMFLDRGIYGAGSGEQGSDRPVAQIEDLLKSGVDRDQIGGFAHSFVHNHFSFYIGKHDKYLAGRYRSLNEALDDSARCRSNTGDIFARASFSLESEPVRPPSQHCTDAHGGSVLV